VHKTCFFLLLFTLLSIHGLSQTVLLGTVVDSVTNKPMAYCNIAIKGSTAGTISNSDGAFRINVDVSKDTLLFSFLGYKRKSVAAKELAKTNVLFLCPIEIALQELVVHANEEYLYDIVKDCRKNIHRDQNWSGSKAYFGLETLINGRPAEMLECYYNADIKGIMIDNLGLKNGRVGLAIIGSRIFNTWETSTVISKLDLVNSSYLFPTNPLQFDKKGMKKTFRLVGESSDTGMYHIKFYPRDTTGEAFSGELWIDKQSSLLLKIQLHAENAPIHPFVSYIEDSIKNVAMDITQSFRLDGEFVYPELIQFDYSFTYVSGSGKARTPDVALPDMARTINSKSVLYFYDYGAPFQLPYFEYDKELGDYFKISMIPYNSAFWDENNALLLTDRQKDKLGIIASDGYLINFKEGNYGQEFCNILNNERHRYHVNFTFWAPDKRIFFTKGLPQTEPYPLEKINQSIQSDLYSLKVQLLLDVNRVNDTLDYRSYTVFDEAKTYFHLQKQDYTAIFLNIYFDICEMERRKMDALLHSGQHTIAEVDSIYQVSNTSMAEVTKRYLDEVEVGKNGAALKKWNQYVFDALGIDNISIFKKETEKE
jgi:hypothetical protein